MIGEQGTRMHHTERACHAAVGVDMACFSCFLLYFMLAMLAGRAPAAPGVSGMLAWAQLLRPLLQGKVQ
jgi:hypothetical protein